MRWNTLFSKTCFNGALAEEKETTQLRVDSEANEARRTPAYDRLQRGVSSENMRVKKMKVSAVEDSRGVEVPLWWTGFGEQETRPNSKVGIESRERVTFTPPTPLTPSTKAALKKETRK